MNWPTKKFIKISDDEIINKFFVALNQLFKNDAFLLDTEVHERSTAHKLAEYLQQQFLDWHVDCEYSKKGLDQKILDNIRGCDEQRKTNRVYPDIIIHRRNCKDNLLVIEMKLERLSKINECDNKKLIEFTKKEGEYAYQLGLFIGFAKLDEPQIVWYKNGKQQHR